MQPASAATGGDVDGDVNQDGRVTPRDALLLINRLAKGDLNGRPWWQNEGGVAEIVAGALEQVRDEVAAHGVDAGLARAEDVRDLVAAHLDRVRDGVQLHFQDRASAEACREMLGDLEQTRAQIREQFAAVHQELGRHAQYQHGEFYAELRDRCGVELSADQVDALFDRLVRDEGVVHDPVDEGSVAWHTDYVRDLIDRHVEYLRAGVDPEQVDSLLAAHVDYVVDLFKIHDIEVSDERIGELVDRVYDLIVWIDSHDDAAGGRDDGANLRLTARERQMLWAHVGYVKGLISQHAEVFRYQHEWLRWLAWIRF